MPRRPSGTTTFLFTDIEGSTDLLRRLGESQYARVLSEHRRLLRGICHREGGREIGSQGDGLFMAFARARDAVAAAVAAQLALLEHSWPEGAGPRVRMAIHTGEPAMAAGEFVGLDLHRAARICDAGHGGQILVSATAGSLIEGRLAAQVTLRNLGSHRLRDLQQPEQLFQVVHPDLPQEFPALRSLETSPNNLPRQLTSFVGRERELGNVKRLLSATSILMLTGTGGCGKTRLALAAAADLIKTYADGVWFVELAALGEPGLVVNTVASALGVRTAPAATLENALTSYLRPRTLLLVLDNCEHLSGACADLVKTLTSSCPRLRILATSREPLGVPGETVWQVPSLSLPASEEPLSVKDLMQYEAPRLFVERAAAVRPGFAPTPQDAGPIAAICRHLDGIPLAIELAAARMQVLSVNQIAARLNERFRLLTGGGRTAVQRQRTLRGALDWSYDLLSEKERALMRRLAVFAGTWTLEAAEAVCSGDGVERSEILDLLAQLVSKSLVLMNTQDGQARYRMLETVRAYGRERLDEANEGARTRAGHLQWYLRLTEQAESELSGADQVMWLSRLEAEYDNFRAALEWSKLDGSSGEPGVRLAQRLWQLWLVRGDYGEGRMWLETMLSRYRVPDSLRAKALRDAGFAAWRQGDSDGSIRLCTEALGLFRDLGDQAGVGGAIYLLACVALYRGELERAKALHLESLALRRKVGDKRRIAMSLNSLGEVARVEGDYAGARAAYEESLDLARAAEDGRAIINALSNLGFVSLHEGDHVSAAKFFEEGLGSASQLGYKLAIATQIAGLGGVAASRAEYVRAARLFGAAETLLSSLGASLATPDRAQYDRCVEATRAALDETSLAKALAEGRAMTAHEATEYGLGSGP
jgi:predicted ATPase/class 3 adenylate cyclase